MRRGLSGGERGARCGFFSNFHTCCWINQTIPGRRMQPVSVYRSLLSCFLSTTPYFWLLVARLTPPISTCAPPVGSIPETLTAWSEFYWDAARGCSCGRLGTCMKKPSIVGDASLGWPQRPRPLASMGADGVKVIRRQDGALTPYVA